MSSDSIPDVPKEIQQVYDSQKNDKIDEKEMIRQTKLIIQRQSNWMNTLQKAEKLIQETAVVEEDDDEPSMSEMTSMLTEEEESVSSENSADYMDEETLRQAYIEQKQEAVGLRKNLEKIVNQLMTYKEDIEFQNEELQEQIVNLKNKSSEQEKQIKKLTEENIELVEEFEEEIEHIQKEHQLQQKGQIENLKEIFDEVEYVQKQNEELTQELSEKAEELRDFREKNQNQEEEILELRLKLKKLEEDQQNQPPLATLSKSTPAPTTQDFLNVSSPDNITLNMPSEQRLFHINSLLQKAIRLSLIPSSNNLDSSASSEDIFSQFEKLKRTHKNDLDNWTQEKRKLQEERDHLTNRFLDLNLKYKVYEAKVFSDNQIILSNFNFLLALREIIEVDIVKKFPSDSGLTKLAEELKHAGTSGKKGASLWSAFDKRGSLMQSNNNIDNTKVQEIFDFEEKNSMILKNLQNLLLKLEEHLNQQNKQFEERAQNLLKEAAPKPIAQSLKKNLSSRKESLTQSLSPDQTSKQKRLSETGKKMTYSKARFMQLQKIASSTPEPSVDDEIITSQLGKKMSMEIKFQTRSVNDQFFFSAFETRAAMNWMLRLATIQNRDAAVNLGQKMTDLGLIQPCKSDGKFADEEDCYFYFPSKESSLKKQSQSAKQLQELFQPPVEPQTQEPAVEEFGTLRKLKKTNRERGFSIDNAASNPVIEEKQLRPSHSTKNLAKDRPKSNIFQFFKTEEGMKGEEKKEDKKKKSSKFPSIRLFSANSSPQSSNPSSPRDHKVDVSEPQGVSKRGSLSNPADMSHAPPPKTSTPTASRGNSGSEIKRTNPPVTKADTKTSAAQSNPDLKKSEPNIRQPLQKTQSKINLKKPQEEKTALAKKESSTYKTISNDIFVDPATCFCSMNVIGFDSIIEKNKTTILFQMEIQFHETKWQILRDYKKIYECTKWVKFDQQKKLLPPAKYAKKTHDSVSRSLIETFNALFTLIVEKRPEILKKYKREFQYFVVPIGAHDKRPDNYLVPFDLDVGK